MKNIHRIYVAANEEVIKVLKQNGINEKKGFISLTLNEEDEVYKGIKPHLSIWKANDYIYSSFNTKEIDASRFLVWMADWQPLYPMPKDNFDFYKLSFDLLQFCSHCRIGAVQKAPIRISNSPNWGNKKMFILHWIFDEVFCKKSFYELVFKKYGIGYWDVYKYGTDTIIEDVVQLKLPSANANLMLKGYNTEMCPKCKRKKYLLINHGFFPSFKDTIIEELHFFKSNEDFGSGGDTRKCIFISQQLKKELEELGVKSRYYPQAVSSSTKE